MHPGGTLGLFTGMSILSVFEVVYWIVIIVAGELGRKKKTGM